LVIPGVTMSDVATFKSQLQTLLGSIRTARPNAPIVLVNMVDIAVMPFFNQIKPYIINPATGAKIYLLGEDGPLHDGDFVTLTASAYIKQGFGIPGTGRLLPEGSFDATGVHAGFVIRASEMALVRSHTAAINAAQAEAAAAVGAKVWDFNAFANRLATSGYTVGGMKLTLAFLTGGILSYDGVHQQQLGNAVFANELIKLINREFKGTIPEVNFRPFLGISASATSVQAASATLSVEAAKSLIRQFAPGALMDRFELPRTIRKRIPAMEPKERAPLPR
ncbi:MAG: hypothetical protein V1750_07275, partial [Acidobacteriota bacterium]